MLLYLQPTPEQTVLLMEMQHMTESVRFVIHRQTIINLMVHAPGGSKSHNDGLDCRTCHGHLVGFQQTDSVEPPHDFISDCTVCHVTPDTYVHLMQIYQILHVRHVMTRHHLLQQEADQTRRWRGTLVIHITTQPREY